MSIETWSEEFYSPITRAITSSKVAAIQHCIKKWEGLRRANLARHGIVKVKHDTDLEDPNGVGYFTIDSETCALCMRQAWTGCDTCELALARGGKNCCDEPLETEEYTPYDVWERDANPEPMIFWLKKALENQA